MSQNARIRKISFVSAVVLVLCAAGFGSRFIARAQGQKELPVAQMVNDVLTACRTKIPMAPPTQTYGLFSMEDAYRIQDALNHELEKDLGRIAGYKVAYASKAAQKQFGMAEPAYSALFRIQQLPSGTRLKDGETMALLIETEIAFTVGKRMDRPLRTVDELKPNIQYIHASFDIGENRFDPKGPKPTASDAIASGVAAHRFVLGPAFDPNAADTDRIILKLIANGKTFSECPATDVMGSPWNSILWIVNRLVQSGKTLEPGDVLLSGTAGPAYRAFGAERFGTYVGDCGPLGQVTLTIE